MKASKPEALRRLAYIEGHVKGIRRMVENDEYCVDILKQTRAVKRALDRFDALLLEGHFAGCVAEGFREGRDDDVLRELHELFDLSRR
ncbi:MAG TPA: metal-sensitive transcriptional regulator [Dehalococcoidia bacterium]|nr:metal-sensitive transcriptional regulator [Dehalococcoidia bacterium]